MVDFITKNSLLIYKRFPIFLITFIFLISLIFVKSNVSLITLSIIYLFLLNLKLKNLESAIFLSFIATLPFTKGKTFELILLQFDQVKTFSAALYDIEYLFPIYISDVFLFLLIWVIIRKNNFLKRIKLVKLTSVEYSLIAFLVLVIISGSLAIIPLVPLLSAFQLLKMFVLIIIPSLLVKKPKIEALQQLFVASILFQFFLVSIQKIVNGPIGIYIESVLFKNEFGTIANEISALNRFSGSFFEPSILGTFLLLSCPFIFQSYKKTKNKNKKIMFLATIFAIIFSVFATGSRGIYLIFFLYLFFQERNFFFREKKETKPIVLFVTFLMIFSPYLLTRFYDFGNLFSRFGSGTYRLQMFKESINLAIENPLGVGLDLSPYSFGTKKLPRETIFDPAHPHNIFFQVLAETGFFGLIIFGYFIISVFKKIPNSKDNPFFISILLFLASAQIYPIFINQIEIISFLFLLIGLSKVYKKA